MLRRPAFGLAELTWRWSFGVTCWLLLTFTALEYLDTLQVSGGDILLLETRNPVLILQAIAHIIRGSGFRLLEATCVFSFALGIGWIFVAALARSATVRSTLAYFRENDSATSPSVGKSGLGALLGLNFLRFLVTLLASVGCLAAFLLGGLVSPSSNPAPGSAFLLFLTVLLLICLAWSVLNWFLSLAANFAVVDDQSCFSALVAAAAFCRERTGSVLAVSTWFGLAHIAVFVLASSAVGFLLGLSQLLPPVIIFGGLMIVTLVYFALVDFLYVGRLAGYLAILEFPEQTVPETRIRPDLHPSSAVDRDELILGDLPQQA